MERTLQSSAHWQSLVQRTHKQCQPKNTQGPLQRSIQHDQKLCTFYPLISQKLPMAAAKTISSTLQPTRNVRLTQKIKRNFKSRFNTEEK